MPAAQSDGPLSIAGAEWFRRPELRAVFEALNRDGHEARIVGGALRNTLMGVPIGDIDFAATAEPEEMLRLAKAAGLKTVPTGLSHGTITIIAHDVPFEATTLRHDIETDGRFAKVAFTNDWAADAARRDFTINALYAGADGRVYDPLGEGIADIASGRVRFIGQAANRISEDYLRILRFFRFTAEYSETPPDPDGLAACIEGRAGLAILSAERIRAELLRILTTRNPLLALEPMADCGILGAILGSVATIPVFKRLVEIEAHCALSPNPIRRLAALAVMITEDATRLAKRLKLSNAEAGRLHRIADFEPVLEPGMSEKSQHVALYRLGRDAFTDRVLMAWSCSGADVTDQGWQALYALPKRWQAPLFPVTGKDLLSRGFKAAPELGITLRRLENIWIASDFTLSRDELLVKADPPSVNGDR